MSYSRATAAILGNYGVGHLTIKEAASLTAKCLLCEGTIEIEHELEVVSLRDKKLDELLKDHIAFYEQKITSAVEKGSLKPSLLSLDINENVVKEETYIECYDLSNWLEERGVHLGDLFQDDYLSEIFDTIDLIEKTVEKARIKSENSELAKNYCEDKEYDFLRLYNKIHELEKELAGKNIEPKEKSLSTRTRETTLKLIIGMAIEAAKGVA